MIDIWCPTCALHVRVPRERLGEFEAVVCPRCESITVPMFPKGLDVYGTLTLYERRNKDANLKIITNAKRFKFQAN